MLKRALHSAFIFTQLTGQGQGDASAACWLLTPRGRAADSALDGAVAHTEQK